MFQIRLSGPVFRPRSGSVRDAVLFVLAVFSSQLLRLLIDWLQKRRHSLAQVWVELLYPPGLLVVCLITPNHCGPTVKSLVSLLSAELQTLRFFVIIKLSTG